MIVTLALAACGGSAAPASAPSAAGSVAAKPAGSAAASGSASTQLKTMKIATPVVGSAFAYLYVARDLGMFKAHGIDPQILSMPPSNAVAALQAGDLDYAATTGSIIRSALKGIPERVVQVAANRPNFTVLGAKGVTSLDQLRGKVIAVDAPGSTSFVMLTELLKRKGFQKGDYKTVAANSDQSRSLLVQNNQAQGCIVDVANAVKFETDGYPVLAKVADFPDEPFSGLGSSTAALQKNRDFMKAGLQASLEGVAAMRSRKTDVVPIMAKTLNITEQQAGNVFDAMKDSWTTDGKPNQAATDFELANDQVTLELKEKPSPSQVYDFSLLDELAKKS